MTYKDNGIKYLRFFSEIMIAEKDPPTLRPQGWGRDFVAPVETDNASKELVGIPDCDHFHLPESSIYRAMAMVQLAVCIHSDKPLRFKCAHRGED